MEIAQAQFQQPGKGEDKHLVRPIDTPTGLIQLLAVADGLSLNNGKAAASWVIDFLSQLTTTDNPRVILEELKRALSQSDHRVDQSETTLTCGILRQVGTEEDTFLRFDYFAIGDSPIWKVITSDSKYPFQRFLVHGPPYPAETARVYSAVRLHERDIKGVVAFGAVEVASGEVLVVCTDGIPERQVFVRDFSEPEVTSSDLGLCRWLFQQSPYQNDKLAEVLAAYHRRGVLFDDATIITARLMPPYLKDADTHSITDIPATDGSVVDAPPSKPDLDATFPAGRPSANLAFETKRDLLSESSIQTSLNASDGATQPKVDENGRKEAHVFDLATPDGSAATPLESEGQISPTPGNSPSAPILPPESR